MKTSNNYKNNNQYYELNEKNSGDICCCLKFSQCDENNHQMWNLQKSELKKFIAYAKKVESMPWQEIICDSGLKYEKISNLAKPSYLDKGISLYSMRVSQKFRIYGYRSECFYYIVWFDKNHEEA